MRMFYAEASFESNHQQVEKSNLKVKIEKEQKQVKDAIIGVGTALKQLQEHLSALELEYSNMTIKTTTERFFERFGIQTHDVDLYKKPTQEEVDKINIEE